MERGNNMAFGDMFKGSYYKEELDKANRRIAELEAAFTPEMQEADALKKMVFALYQEKAEIEASKDQLDRTIVEMNSTKVSLENDIEAKKKQVLTLDDEILLQEFGLYRPRYEFANTSEYKAKLDSIRNKQKNMIRSETAIDGNMNWTVNNSAAQGKKMIKDMQKLLLRAFNSDCDDAVSKVKYNNFDASLKKITSSRNAISKLGTVMNLSISPEYYDLKVEELTLSFEYQQKKQEEKEEQKAIREQLREEAKLQKEIEEARKNIEKEKKHYTNAFAKAEKEYAAAKTDDEKNALREKLEELQSH